MTTQNIAVTARERDTLLAALRYYQFYRIQGHPFDPRQDHLIDIIAQTTGSALDIVEIDDLCAGLQGSRKRSPEHSSRNAGTVEPPLRVN